MLRIEKANRKNKFRGLMSLNSQKLWTFLRLCSKITVKKIKILLNVSNISPIIWTEYGK